MDVGTILFWVLIAIIALAVFGIILQRYGEYRIKDMEARANAYNIRMSANATVILRLREHGMHRITIDSLASMTVEPRPQIEQDIQPPQTSQSVRYIVDDAHPDSDERKDLLAIVNHTIVRTGDGEIIRAGNQCQKDGLMSGPRWQKAINYGALMFGVITRPQDKTEVGAYKTLSRLAEAINKYETIKPPAPA